jgi:hypothetical protein
LTWQPKPAATSRPPSPAKPMSVCRPPLLCRHRPRAPALLTSRGYWREALVTWRGAVRQVYGQGVTCIGATDFPSQLANQSSQLYANNVSSLMQSFGAKGYFHMVGMSDDAGLTSVLVMAACEQRARGTVAGSAQPYAKPARSAALVSGPHGMRARRAGIGRRHAVSGGVAGAGDSRTRAKARPDRPGGSVRAALGPRPRRRTCNGAFPAKEPCHLSNPM